MRALLVSLLMIASCSAPIRQSSPMETDGWYYPPEGWVVYCRKNPTDPQC